MKLVKGLLKYPRLLAVHDSVFTASDLTMEIKRMMY